jgi:predicted transcriptional regulator
MDSLKKFIRIESDMTLIHQEETVEVQFIKYKIKKQSFLGYILTKKTTIYGTKVIYYQNKQKMTLINGLFK